MASRGVNKVILVGNLAKNAVNPRPMRAGI